MFSQVSARTSEITALMFLEWMSSAPGTNRLWPLIFSKSSLYFTFRGEEREVCVWMCVCETILHTNWTSAALLLHPQEKRCGSFMHQRTSVGISEYFFNGAGIRGYSLGFNKVHSTGYTQTGVLYFKRDEQFVVWLWLDVWFGKQAVEESQEKSWINPQMTSCPLQSVTTKCCMKPAEMWRRNKSLKNMKPSLCWLCRVRFKNVTKVYIMDLHHQNHIFIYAHLQKTLGECVLIVQTFLFDFTFNFFSDSITGRILSLLLSPLFLIWLVYFCDVHYKFHL